MSATPAWADEPLGKELPALRDMGEGQQLEYMGQYPENGRELAKEIAAFASSDGGMILIGVEDDGALSGVPRATEMAIRDSLCRRLEGLCHGAVTPSITPLVRWAIEGDKAVLAVSVPEGTEPVYYANGIPYVRHLSSSRPAAPHEVVRLVLDHHRVEVTGESIPPWVPHLASLLLPVLTLGNELDERMVDPWISQLRAQFKNSADQLRDLLSGAELPSEHTQQARYVVSLLQAVADLRPHLGYGAQLTQCVQLAREAADTLWQQALTPFQSALGGSDAARSLILKALRQLNDLGERARAMLFGGASDEFLAEVSRAGELVLEAAILNLRTEAPSIAQELIEIGAGLHVIETSRLHLDGGQSQERVMTRVGELRGNLSKVAEAAFGPEFANW